MRTALVIVSVLALAGCSDDPQSTPVSVTTAANSCDVAPTSAPAGTVVFAVQNTGTQAADFYLYGQADRIVGELEGIGPGRSAGPRGGGAGRPVHHRVRTRRER